MKAYETLTEATRRRIRKAHSKIKCIGVLYLIGALALAILAFLPAIKIGETDLGITTAFGLFSDGTLGIICAVLYLFIILSVVINLFRAFGKMGRLLKKTARYVRLNRNLDAMEDLARIYSGSLAAIINFTFIIAVLMPFTEITLLGYITLALGLFFHFICGCFGGTISTFTSHASIEENKRKCGLAVYFVRNFLQVLAMVWLFIFFMKTNTVAVGVNQILGGDMSALMSDVFNLIVFVFQLLLIPCFLVMTKHATASTEYNVWGSEGPGMLNFRVFSFFSFVFALGAALIMMLMMSKEMSEAKYYLYIATISFVMFILDCVLKSEGKDEEEFDLPDVPQRPLPPMMPPAPPMMPAPQPLAIPTANNTFMPPVICVNTIAQPPVPPMEAPAPMMETPAIPDKLPEELPPDEVPEEPQASEWQVTCPSCNAELMVKDGEYHRCPCCTKVFQVRKVKKVVKE